MWKLFLLTALGLGHLVSAKYSVECITTNTTCGNPGQYHRIECDRGEIRIDSVKVIKLEGEECDCSMDSQENGCTVDGEKEPVRPECNGKKSCRFQVQTTEFLQNRYFTDKNICPQDSENQQRAIASRITYMCEEKDADGDTDMTNIVIAATVSALVVLAIVLIVFAVLYMYKRKTGSKDIYNRNADMHDPHYHSNGGFEGDYSTIPADYDLIKSRKSQHKYYTIAEHAKDTDVANGNATAELDNEYDEAKHGRPGQHNDIDKNAYNDCSNGQSITDTYNKILFNKPQNAQTNVGDYSHLSQQGNDYSHLGDTTDDANPASNDYNRLQEKVGDYDDARTPSPEDSDNETNLNTEDIKRRESFEEPVLDINTEDHVTDGIDHMSSDDADSEEENSSEMKTDALQPPFKNIIDEPVNSSSIDEDCVSLDSYESLPDEENNQQSNSTGSKRDSYEIPDLNPTDTEEGFDAEIDNYNITDDKRLGDTSMDDSSAIAVDSVDG